jgi:hypothetical protein
MYNRFKTILSDSSLRNIEVKGAGSQNSMKYDQSRSMSFNNCTISYFYVISKPAMQFLDYYNPPKETKERLLSIS